MNSDDIESDFEVAYSKVNDHKSWDKKHNKKKGLVKELYTNNNFFMTRVIFI